LQKAEIKDRTKLATAPGNFRKLKRRFLAAAAYYNAGTEDEPVFIKGNKPISSFVGSGAGSKQSYIEMLQKNGDAYTNVDDMMHDERVLNRANAISVRLKEDFDPSSEEWKRWTNKTSQYNATSLTQVCE
jgi:hypothetical protein